MDQMHTKPNMQTIDEIVRRIVRAIQPQRIILFGSAASGRMGPNSDLDLLIVVRDGCHTRRVAQFLYSQLRGVGCAKDLIVVQESDLRKYGDNPYLILREALRKGKELYRATA